MPAFLESDFTAAYEDARTGLRLGYELPLLRALCSLSSGMGGLERDGSDVGSVEFAAASFLCLCDDELLTEVWAAGLTAEAAMSVGRLELAEAVARRVWCASRGSDPPAAVFARQSLARALLFQGRLANVSALAPEVEAAAQRHGLVALGLVVDAAQAYVDALTGRTDELIRRASRIDETAPRCPASYFVAGALVLAAYALAAAQQAKQAAEMLLRGAGGPTLRNLQLVDRAYGYELLVTAALSVGDVHAAREWADRAAGLTGLPPVGMAAAALRRINARVAVADGQVATAAAQAEQARRIAAGNAGHLDATRAQLLAGSARLLDVDHHRPAPARAIQCE